MRIFLDQKDFSSIARGLSGLSGYEEYARHFAFLKGLVESGKITIYFSWSHIVESLRYRDLTGPLWNIHCEVVDTLTKGNCILFPTELERRELELYVSDHFRVQTKLLKNDYAFGKYKDAVCIDVMKSIPSEDYLEEALKRHIAELGYSRNDRRLLFKKISKGTSARDIFEKMTEREFNDFLKGIDEAKYPKVLIDELRAFLDRTAFIDLLLGTPAQKIKLSDKFLDSVFEFRKLVTIYSQEFPELEKIGQFPDETYQKLNPLVMSSRILQDISSKPVVDFSKVKSQFIEKYIKSIRPRINKYAKKSRFDRKEAERILREESLMPLPSIHSAILFFIEYLRRNVGPTKRGRRLRQSDVMDLHNLRNIPYVDLYVADKFFADLAEEVAPRVFGTRIFRNLSQLEDFLKSNLN